MSRDLSAPETLCQNGTEKSEKKFNTNSKEPKFAKHIALVCICSLTFGSYFCFDSPSALQDKFKRDLDISTATFTTFYSWYNWPNVILCFFSGVLIDNVFGVKLGTVIFSTLVLTGNVIFSLGAFVKDITVMKVGRFIFGLGGESLCVAQNTYAVTWFMDKELNSVFGAMFGVSRLGSTLTLISLTPLYGEINKSLDGNKCLGAVLLISAGLCILPLMFSVVLGFLKRPRNKTTVSNNLSTLSSLAAIAEFPITLWLVLIICASFYCAIFPFISIGKVFYISKYGFSPFMASSTNSIIYLVSIFGFPLYGYLIDSVGCYSKLIIVAICGTIISYFFLTFTFIHPFVGVSLMALSYCLLSSSLWPMIALIVPKHQVATAYGMMLSSQNIAMAVVNILTGIIVDRWGYFVIEIFFLTILYISLMAAIFLYFIDASRNGPLGKPKERKETHMQLNIQEYERID